MYRIPPNSPSSSTPIHQQAVLSPTTTIAISITKQASPKTTSDVIAEELKYGSYKKFMARKVSDETRQRLEAHARSLQQLNDEEDDEDYETEHYDKKSIPSMSQSVPIKITGPHHFFSMATSSSSSSTKKASKTDEYSTEKTKSNHEQYKKINSDHEDGDIFDFEP